MNYTRSIAMNGAQPIDRTDGTLSVPPVLIRYWHMAMRWRWVMLAVIAGCLALGLIVTLLMAPLYTANTQIQIDRQQKRITKVEGLEAESADQDLEFYATQYELLKARPLAERVAAQLNLDFNPAFFEAHGVDPVDAVGPTAGKSQTQIKADRRRLVVDILRKNISVSPIRMSRLVDISYTSRSPEMSAKIANEWAASFIAINMDQQFASTADARDFLEKRLGTLRQRLEDSERQVILFASKSGIVSLERGRDEQGRTMGSTTLMGSNLEALAGALNIATSDRVKARARAESIGDMTPESVSSPTLASLREKRSLIAADYAKTMVLYEPDFPAAKELNRQLRALDASIATENRRIADARRQEYQEAVRREDDLSKKVEILKADLDRQNRANIQYTIFQREADTNRQLYDALLQRYKEIGIAGSVGINNVTIVEPAVVPEKPSSPKILINIALALIAGIALATGAALALEQVDEGIREPSAVESALGLPLLGITPVVEGNLIEALDQPKSHFFDAYFTIRSSLAFSTNQGFPRSLAVISTRPAEGKSSTSLALAAILGRTDKRVLLVDADLRSPSIHALVGLDNGKGLSNFLSGQDDWSTLAHSTRFKNLTVLPAGPVPPSAAELLSGERLSQFVREALEKFDHLIIDSPPVLGMTDAPLIAKEVDGAVYVVQAGGPAVRGIRASIDRLKKANAHVYGIVLTKVGGSSSGDGYGYGYGRGYGYDYRYGEHDQA